MATDDMIASLVRHLRPVRPLPLPRIRLARWGLVAFASLAIVTAALGPRVDLRGTVLALPFHAHAVLLFVVAVTSAIAALTLAIPGERLGLWRRGTPLAAGLAWTAWLAGELWVVASSGGGLWPGVAGVGCVAKAFAFGVTPGIAMMIMLGRGAPTNVRATMTFASLAAAAVGALGVELTCPMTSPSHVLVWHAGPVVAAAMAAWVAGHSIFDIVSRAVPGAPR